ARPLPDTLLSETPLPDAALPNEPLQDDPLNEPLPNEPAQGAWRYAVKPLDVEAWAGDFAPEDGRFLQFNQWSRDYFIQVSGNMVRRRLDTSTLKAEELEALSQLMGLLNSRYFSGTSYLNAQDIPGSPGYRLLQEHEYEFLSGYARTIMADNFPRDTELTIPFAGR
ncbi:MAG: hypothetical protein LBH73_00675, partial [Spirochaetaceae bacterium]|nr:hypothetical protein [Spirochaetaceae bacterium]